jgi:hypothetical protein
MALLVVIPGAVASGWVCYQQARPPTGNILAVVLVTLESDGRTTSRMVNLYDTGDGSFEALGAGITLNWSPDGRYLASSNGGNLGWGASGTMTSFTIWDLQTRAVHTHDYAFGNYLSWSPESDYLVASSLRYIGSHAYESSFIIFSLSDTGLHEWVSMGEDGPGMTGMNTGVAPLRWTSDNRLLIVSDSAFTTPDNPNGYSIVDPESGEREAAPVADQPTTLDLPPLWEPTMTSLSPDGRLQAAAVNPLDSVVTGTPTIWITDLETGITHPIALPDNTLLVQGIAWRPRSAA